MEIRQVVRGGTAGFAPARPAKASEEKPAGAQRPSTDRVELSRQWIRSMEEQRAQVQSALGSGGTREKEEGGILGYMETEEDKLDALSEQLDSQMKCIKIASNIMRGKKVPPQDEQYLMEHDPEAYKLAVSMRGLVKEDDEECESVLEDEEENSSGTSETGEAAEAAPAEGSSGGEASGGEGASSGGGEGE